MQHQDPAWNDLRQRLPANEERNGLLLFHLYDPGMSFHITAIPTVALTPSAIPDSHKDHGHPFFQHTGYARVGQEAIIEIMHRAEEQGLDALNTDELRIELQRARRAHRHGGGHPGDASDTQMARVLRLIRERVAARGGNVGLWRGDITQLHVDVIVNAANRALSGGGGVDGAIQKAAGPELLAATLALPEISPGVRCQVGDAVLTPGFKLPARYVAHAVGPVWEGEEKDEPKKRLASAYYACLNLASSVKAESIAFPAISTGAYGFPSWDAALVAVHACHRWRQLNDTPLRIVLVPFDDRSHKHLRSALRRIAR